jgi:hypothetical protein
LRVEISLSPHMTKASLIKRGWRARACRRRFLGFSGGCPAFAAFHQHISNGPITNL